MNRELLDKVLPHLHVQTAFPTRIDAKVATWFDRRQAFESFTRINWAVSEISVAEVVFPGDPDQQPINFMKFMASTRTWIVKTGDEGIPANDAELNEEEVVCELQIDFAVEYIVAGCKPEELPQEAVSEYAANNMPYHLWPYYRQTVQDIALRLQVPMPTVPFFRVPKTHQPEK
ncbi:MULTISPECIES: hypothetical protein [Burkholderia cepacia complex]|uniref:hypothetical protein n=1 Tax=Burkholderia cepacia complex TaxID=87882 RepID=UPI001BA16100|nr:MULTISPECIES: hypothetical protein [Burkholderia cepacia complex]MBR7987980.1 hypothetical protein [Burkholderia cenocepacia]MBR8309497.1 hypothetical protein [Burkholderia cenocepacia]MCA7966350.1 hypothetical protein [Burkholderia cenocepacia]MDN7584167.1 hypothetical protein [Burkholderia orbicola]MDR8058063.1 hypothetical protein [Burkholderia cenocepacia]